MLVVCHSCGRKVSERAPVCPFCRAPRVGADRSASPLSAGLLKPGDPIGADIQVLEVLGEGGFGIVYLARSNRVGFCAVKTLRDELLLDERVVDLFQKEARIWIELDRHPYIVRAFYVEEVGGRFYIAMEYVPPNERRVNDLEGYLHRRTPDLGQALWWAIEFCHGMEYAYSKGVRCHRDIKPANILIGPDNRIRITDFGIAGVIVAKSRPRSDVTRSAVEGATQAGTVFGTPTHMPPEQFVDAAICDARSDIYSFGAVLFQIASGTLPFCPPPVPPGPDRSMKLWSALARLHREEPVPQLDSTLFPIISKCMQKDPAHRYGSFPELRADLEALLKGETGEVVAVPPLRAFEAIDLSNKGMSFAALDQYQEAIRFYDQALAIDPESAPILNNKGNALNRMGRRQEAVSCFDRALALDPKYAAPHLNKGISFVWLNRYEEALQSLDKALSLNSRLVDAWVTKGVVLGRLGREDEAAVCYERALEIDPGDPVAWFNKAGRFHRYGRREEALECVERALQSDPRYGVAWATKGVLLGDLGRHDEALQALERALVLDPDSGKSWYNKGNVFASLEDYDEALHCFQRAASLDPTFPLNWYNKALAETKLFRYGEAESSLRQFLAVAPPNDDFRAGASALLARLEQGERVVLGSLTKGATILSQDGESQQSVKVPVSSTQSGEEPLESKSDNVLGVAGEYEESPREVAPAEPSPPVEMQTRSTDEELSPEECLERAAVTHNQGQFEEAIAWCDRVLAADPEKAAAWAGKGECLNRLGRFEEAVIAIDRALANNPRDAKAWVSLGTALDSLKRHQEAASSYEKALQIEPANALTWNRRGASLFAAGEIEQAIWCFDRALVEDPRFAMARFNKATAEETMGRPTEAARSFQQFLNIAPPNLARQIERARARLVELRGS